MCAWVAHVKIHLSFLFIITSWFMIAQMSFLIYVMMTENNVTPWFHWKLTQSKLAQKHPIQTSFKLNDWILCGKLINKRLLSPPTNESILICLMKEKKRSQRWRIVVEIQRKWFTLIFPSTILSVESKGARIPIVINFEANTKAIRYQYTIVKWFSNQKSPSARPKVVFFFSFSIREYAAKVIRS